jgi:hypothetical protein
VADFDTKLRWLSERGDPVGAEELIERIEADLAGDPLVVVAKRRERTLMTKTQPSLTISPASRSRGLAWAVAAFVAVLAVAGLIFAFTGDPDQVADDPPPPTTVAPDVETMSDLEVIEAGVAAFYSGDAERAAELFELPDRTDEEIREEAAYQAAIGGRLTLNCSGGEGGVFVCRVPYHNAMTDAIGSVDSGDTNRVVVDDGVITAFGFPEHTWMVVEMGHFLAGEGSFEGYGPCGFGPFPELCATIQLDNLDAWVEWRENLEPVVSVEAALESWYRGDCEAALFVAGPFDFDDPDPDNPDPDCSTSSKPGQWTEYESILGAQVSVEGCEDALSGEDTVLSCQVHYSNAMTGAVGEQPSVTAREFIVRIGMFVREPGSELPWYEGVYPEDTELLASFRLFAESSDLSEQYAAGSCASHRTPVCAQLIVDHLEEWAAWYETNG